jgi:hypothetical protein
MKRTHYLMVGVIFALLVGCFAAGFVSTKVFSQTERKLKIDRNFEWKPVYFPLVSTDSAIKLKLNDLSQNTEWILGVEIVDENAKDEIAIGQIQWETIKNHSGSTSARLPVSITDADFSLLNSSEGETRLSGVNDSEKTFMIHLKVTPKTAVSLWRGEQKLVENLRAKNLVLLNGKEVNVSPQMRTLFAQMMKARLYDGSLPDERKEIQ